MERKFLISSFPQDLPLVRRGWVRQGYICTRPVVRIRVTEWENNELSYVLCFKGKGSLARQETEIALTPQTFNELAALLRGPFIQKDYRVYRLPDGHLLECSLVDAGKPTSYMFAEIEFDSEAEALAYPAPPQVGPEITGKGLGMAHYWEKTRGGLDEKP